MKLLVIGASGLVGGKVAQKARSMGMDVSGTYNLRRPPPGIPCSKLDVADHKSVLGIVSKESPDAVINASALHDAGYCERHPQASHAVNSWAVADLTKACVETGAKLIHLSTARVFDGSKKSYSERDAAAPLGAYGSSKLAGEEVAIAWGQSVVRTSAVYGWAPAELAGERSSSGKGANFALRLLKSLSAGKKSSAATCQHATYTLADWLAESLLAVAESREIGLFHAAGAHCQSGYEFAVQLAEAFGHDRDLVVPAGPAQPAQTTHWCLDSSRIWGMLGVSHPSIGKALGIMRGQVGRGAPELLGGR